MQTKKCGKCQQVKPISEFYPHRRDGYQSSCKDCKREESKNYNRTPRRREYNKLKYQEWVDKGGLVEYRKRLEVAERVRVGAMVQNALQTGRLKKYPCLVCGEKQVQAHHRNYDKPFIVMWLCRKHHIEEHIRIKVEGR